MKYLSYDGLSHLKLLLKNALSKKSDTGHKHTKSEITDYTDYELPTASAETLGGVKVGAGLVVNEGVLSATGGGTADAVDWSNVTNKPTNVSSFSNDAGYITTADIPSEYITETELNSAISTKANTSDIPTNVGELSNDAGYITVAGIPSEYITETELDDKNYVSVEDLETMVKDGGIVEWEDVVNKPTVPTNNNQLTNGAGYQTASDVEAIVNSKVSSVMNYKGTVANYSDLPSNAALGDTYNITNAGDNNKAGDNLTWNGSSWDNLGGVVDLSGYVENTDLQEITNEEIEAIWNS